MAVIGDESLQIFNKTDNSWEASFPSLGIKSFKQDI
jgi:hypothetical protein